MSMRMNKKLFLIQPQNKHQTRTLTNNRENLQLISKIIKITSFKQNRTKLKKVFKLFQFQKKTKKQKENNLNRCQFKETTINKNQKPKDINQPINTQKLFKFHLG